MAQIVEFVIVGRTPLGGALRAGLIGVVATAIGELFFTGFWGPLAVGAIVVLVLLPVAYALSRRDDPASPSGIGGPENPGARGRDGTDM